MIAGALVLCLVASGPPACPEGSAAHRHQRRVQCERPDGTLHGAWEERGPKGELLAEGAHLEGLAEGVWREWAADGQLLREVHWSRGREHGPGRAWHAHGKLWQAWSAVEGKLDGRLEEWWSSGQLKVESTYRKGVLMASQRWTQQGAPENRTIVHYHGNGRMAERLRYERGHLHGPYQAWYRSGQLRVEGSFVENRRQGPWRQWDERGALLP